MANLLSCVTGNLTSASTWALVDSTSYLNSETGQQGTSTTPGLTSAFTPGAITVDAICVKIGAAGATSGTQTFELYNNTGAAVVAGTTVTINSTDLTWVGGAVTTNAGWTVLKFAAPVTLLAATSYSVRFVSSTSGQGIILWRDATTNNISRMLRTTTTQAPAAGDDLVVAGELTGAGTGNDITVTMDSTAATDYGSAQTAVNGLVTPALSVCKRGTLTYGTTAATNYVLRLSGNLIVYNGGTLNIGTTGTPIPRDGTAVLEFDQLSADGDYGLLGRNGSTVNIQGLSRTSGKNIVSAKLTRTTTKNWIIRSEEFDNAAWTKNATTISANATTAPDGNVTADSVATTATTNSGVLLATIISAAGVPYVYNASIYAKAISNYLYFTAFDSSNHVWVIFNIATGAVVSSGTNGTFTLAGTPTITAAANGFYRCGFSFLRPSGTSLQLSLTPSDTTAVTRNGASAWLAGGMTIGSSCYIWGVQCEATDTAGSNGPGTYMPTTTAASTYEGIWNVDTDTGWLSGDMVAIASTTQTASDCEAATLASNAGASSLSVNNCTAAAVAQAFPLSSGSKGLSVHEGVASNGTNLALVPQAEVIHLTRNVKIRSTSATLMAYVFFDTTAVVDIDWAEFYYLGVNSTNKRGVEISTTTGSLSIMYSSLHDIEAGGLWTVGSATNHITLTNNVLWNCSTSTQISVIQVAQTTGTDITLDNIIGMRCLTQPVLLQLTDNGVTFTNITAVGCQSTGISITEANGLLAPLGTISNLVSHSNNGANFSFNALGPGTITNVVGYRGGNFVLGGVGPSLAVIDGLNLFGNTGPAQFNINGSGRARIKNAYINNDLLFSIASSIAFSNFVDVVFQDSFFSVVSGIKTAASAQELTASSGTGQMTFLNCVFNAATEVLQSVSGTGHWPRDLAVFSQKHDQTAGNHITWMRSGKVQTDTTIYRTANPSMRMTPNSSVIINNPAAPTVTTTSGSAVLTSVSQLGIGQTNLIVGQFLSGTGIPTGAYISSIDRVNNTITMAAVGGGSPNATASNTGVTLTIRDKLESAPVNSNKGFLYAINLGSTVAPSVYVRKSVVGDGTAYNGNQPRLICRANPALGLASDTVLATASAAAGTWEQLSGTTPTATDDGAFEIVVDCDGTAGWINVDDLA